MARSNPTATASRAEALDTRTYGGGVGSPGNSPEAALRRLVGANLLFENQYYRKGDDTVSDLAKAAEACSPEFVAALAREAASEWKLRHVPLYLTALLSKRTNVRSLVPDVVTRADALAELVAIYARVNDVKTGNLKGHMPMSLKRGLADAFGNFDAYQLSKYDRAQAIRLRDVMFLCHPKPSYEAQATTWTELASDKLAAPDTWEVALSGGKDKKETWERLISERKLGDLAFLRNLRNMTEANVERSLIVDALQGKRFARILPFQFIAATRENPGLESELDAAMTRAVSQEPRLPGATLIVVDVSGSMQGELGGKSKLDRLDAAAGLAILLREVSEFPNIYATAGDDYSIQHRTMALPARHGMALRDSLKTAMTSLGGGGIFFTQSLGWIKDRVAANWGDAHMFSRVVVITDEQDTDKDPNRAPDRAPKLGQRNYILNVGSYDIGLKTRAYWDVVTGFSEAAIRYIAYAEQN